MTHSIVSEMVAVIEVEGEVDVYTAPRLRERIITLVENGHIRLVLDLRNVWYVDSTGLGVIVGGLKRTRHKDGTVVVLPNGQFGRILRNIGLNRVLIPFREVAEAIDFISRDPLWHPTPDESAGLLFRVYIPSGRLYAAEASRLMDLFCDWFTATAGQRIRKSGYQTTSGELREFYVDFFISGMDAQEQLNTFSIFLAVCSGSPSAAADLLQDMNVDRTLSLEIASRFSREIRRLEIDLRHERERRMLSIRHGLEQELMESGVDPDQASSSQSRTLEGLVPLPTIQDSIGLLTGSRISMPTRSATVNINQQIISAFGNAVVQNIQGVNQFGPQAKEILSLIDRFGGNEAADLRSAIHEVEDDEALPYKRSAAGRRLLKFLGQLAGNVQDVGLDLLEKYLESRLIK
jgi:anti-anti-sigma factor